MAEKPHKLTDEEIGMMAAAEVAAATTYDGTDFSKSRVRALEYYRGEMKDLESEEGLSEAASHDVADVMGWILPGLMRVFFSADELGNFEPEEEEDEQAATQATDYANYIIMKECNGYQVFWDVFHDTLLMSNGVVKHWWQEEEKTSVHIFSGLTEDQYAALVNNDEVEIIAQRTDQFPVEPEPPPEPIQLPPGLAGPAPGGPPPAPGGPGQPPAAMNGGAPVPPPNGSAPNGGAGLPPGLLSMLSGAVQPEGPPPSAPVPVMQTFYSVKVRRTVKAGRLMIAAMPPEEFLINAQARDIASARMTGHRMLKTRTELLEMGYDPKIVNDLPASSSSSPETFGNLPQVRRENMTVYPAYSTLDRSMDEIEITEVYMPMDADGDGIAEMMKIVIADPNNKTLLDAELWEDEVPFTDFVAERVPHRWQGRSTFDDTEDIQRIKSTLLRQFLDNLYHSNIPDRAVAIDRISNPDALLDRKIGNNIHTDGDPNGVIVDLQVPFVAKEALTGLEYMDQIIERRTGVSKATMALDLDALQNQTATAVNASQSASYTKIELIARNFAEMGFKRFFECVLKLIVAHQDGPRRIKIKKRWVTMDPSSWNANMKFSANVGLGSGSRDRDAQILLQIAAKQEQINLQMGPDNPLCGLDKYANTLRRLVQMALPGGEPDQFFNEVEPAQLQQWMAQRQQNQPPDPKMVQAQAAQQKAAADIEINKQKAMADAQLSQNKAQADMAISSQKNQLDMSAQREKNDMEMQLDQQKAAQDAQQSRDAAILDAQLKREEMYLEAGLTREANAMQAHTTREANYVAADTTREANRMHDDTAREANKRSADIAHAKMKADVNIQNKRVNTKPKGK